MSLIYDVSFDSTTRVLSLLDKAGNVISSCEVPSKDVDDITKPLTFKATQDGSKVWMGLYNNPTGAFQTSRDGGNTWENYDFGIITLNTGDEVSFRTRADRTSGYARNKYFWFLMEGKIEAWHNVMSMIRTNDFATHDTVVDYAFTNLFKNCTSLVKAPALPATTLADSCYSNMFMGCQSLTKAPELPATTLAQSCYFSMFYGCQSLTKAPELPATTLAQKCYSYMFSGCQSLKEVRIAATTTATDAMKEWLNNVSATGDFYCDPIVGIFPKDSASGIPKNWRRLNIDEGGPAVDDPNKPLMLRAREDNSSVTLRQHGDGTLSNTYQTSTNGKDWTDYTLGTKISLNKGESVYFRCSSHPTTQTDFDYVYFQMTGKIEAWHNAYSMISSDFSSAEGSVGDYGMNGLFEYCGSLTKAPLLLNALSPYCYYGTFLGTSITQAPELPATTLANGCYTSIFASCNSLTQAPELPATTLAERCYSYMFSRCQSLKEVRIAATTTATDALKEWLKNVSATGYFYCDPNATIFTTGESGIPRNWMRRNIADYPN